MSLSTYYKNKSLTADWSVPQYTLNFDKIGTGMNPWFREGEGNESWTQPPLDINVGGLENGYYSNLYYEFSLDYKRSFGSSPGVFCILISPPILKDRTVDFVKSKSRFPRKLKRSYLYLVSQ